MTLSQILGKTQMPFKTIMPVVELFMNCSDFVNTHKLSRLSLTFQWRGVPGLPNSPPIVDASASVNKDGNGSGDSYRRNPETADATKERLENEVRHSPIQAANLQKEALSCQRPPGRITSTI